VFVYFDLGNVLLQFDHRRACRQLAGMTGATPDRIWEIVFAGELERRFELGEITREEFTDHLARQLGCPPERPRWENAAADIFTPIEGMADLARHLHRRGIPLGILSNTNVLHWEFVLQNHRWMDELFSVHALSYRLGLMKPDSRIYRRAAELADSVGEPIFFVDDREENVSAAVEAGWDAVRFRSRRQLEDDLRQRGLLS